MANTVEHHPSSGSPRRGERGPGANDAHRNPNFSRIDRSNPASAHPYESRHPKPTILQQVLGTGPGAKDFTTFKRKSDQVYKPKIKELEQGIRRPRTVLKMELRDLHHGEDFNDPLPPLAKNPQLRRHLNDEKKNTYHDVRQLEQRYQNDDDPRHTQELDRTRKRADTKYEHFLENELDKLNRDNLREKTQLERGRRDASREARKEIRSGKSADDDELSLDTFSDKLA